MRLRIKLSELLISAMTVFMIRPYYIQINEILNSIWAYITVVFFIVSIYLIFKFKYQKNIYLVSIFFGVYFLATLLHNKENIFSCISTIAQAALAYNIGILYLNKTYRRAITKIVPIISSVYLYADALSVFFQISSRVLHIESTMTLLGYDNYAAFYILPLITIKLFFCIQKNGKITLENWICTILCIASKGFTQSYAAVLSFVLLIVLFILLNRFKNIRKMINIKNGIVFILVMFILVYFFEIQNIISAFLLSSGKGLTLNSRTIIWNYVVPRLDQLPLIGLGYLDSQYFLNYFEFPYGFVATHAHNILLDVTIQTGFIGLVVYIVILCDIKFYKKLLVYKHYRIMWIGLICYLILGFFDSYPFLSSFYLAISLLKQYTFLEKRFYQNKKIKIKSLKHKNLLLQ